MDNHELRISKLGLVSLAYCPCGWARDTARIIDECRDHDNDEWANPTDFGPFISGAYLDHLVMDGNQPLWQTGA